MALFFINLSVLLKQKLMHSQDKLISASGSIRSPKSHPDKRFDGDPADSNLFARIVRGELQQGDT